MRHLDADALATMLARVPRARASARRRSSTARSRSARVFGATPTPFHPELVAHRPGGGRRRPAAATASRSRAARCTTRPRSAALVPTVMIFAQSDPPISHTEIEDSPERRAAHRDRRLRPHGGRALDLVAAGELERAADGLRRRPPDRPARGAGDRARASGPRPTGSRTRGRSTRTCCGRSRSSSTAGSSTRPTS